MVVTLAPRQLEISVHFMRKSMFKNIFSCKNYPKKYIKKGIQQDCCGKDNNTHGLQKKTSATGDACLKGSCNGTKLAKGFWVQPKLLQKFR